MIPVKSSNLQAVDYDSETQIHLIQFHSGRVYDYYNVQPSIFESLMSAPSKGKYHHRYIKNRYSYRRIR